MRYKTQRLRSGAIVQAGLNATPRDYFNRLVPRLAPYRAVVLRSFVADSLDRQSSRRRAKVLCDVILVAAQIQLQRVQVEQRLGVNNGQIWVPRPSTRRISTGGPVELQSRSPRGTREGEPTPYDDLDGDMVLVDFIEGDLDYPIIRGSMEHERTLRDVIEGDGWAEGGAGSERGSAQKNEQYSRYAGTEVRLNAQGDYLIDTVGATDDNIEEVVPATGGQIRMRLKDGQKFTVEANGEDVLEVFKEAGVVHVDLGEGATDFIIKGTAFKALYDSHTHPESAGGTTGVPVVSMDVPVGSHLSQNHRVK